MNVYILIAGIISLMATVGHFIMGSKMYLTPIINSDADEIPKRVMQSLFHYMSVFMSFTTLVLFATAFGACKLFENTGDITLFIGIIYGGFAIVQILVAILSPIKNGFVKMFQWIFWIAISVFAIVGSVIL